MKKDITVNNKAIYLLAYAMGLVFILSACSSDDAAQAIADEFVALSGKITSTAAPAGEAGVTVEGIYSSTSLLNPSTTTVADGAFTLNVLKNTDVTVQISKSGFVTLNSAREAFSASEAGIDIEMPTTDEANAVIALAFPGQTLASGAWLAVSVEDNTDTELAGVTITTTQTNIIDEAATNCDGTDSGDIVTIYDPCVPQRDGPMYWAYFSADQDVSVSVSGAGATGSQTGPVSNGEVTFFDF